MRLALIEIYFFEIRFTDLVEITILSLVLFQLYRLMRGTIAMQILLGILSLYLLENIVAFFNMRVFEAFFNMVGDVFVLALIILFHPEIRRLLLVIGRNPFVRRFVRTGVHNRIVDEVTSAALDMSRKRVGALIVFGRSAGLRTYAETGTRIHAEVSRELITSIFFPKNPLHDGAVIIQDERVEAARCILPVSKSQRLDSTLGLRHRAAIGLSEQTDAFVVVVSEERGSISVAENGILTPNLTEEELSRRLTIALSASSFQVTSEPVVANV